MGASKWLTWTPTGSKADNAEASQRESERTDSGFDGFDGGATDPSPIISADASDGPIPSPRATSENEIIQTPPAVEPSKPSLPSITIEQVRKHRLFAPPRTREEDPSVGQSSAESPSYTHQNETALFGAPLNCPPLPRGSKLIRYAPRTPPLKLDDSTSVTNIPAFFDAELRALDARLHSPLQIRAGYGVFMILDRLRQVGLEIEIAVGE